MKGWRQAAKDPVLQQLAGSNLLYSGSYVRQLPFHFVLFSSPTDSTLSRAATRHSKDVKKSSHYHMDCLNGVRISFSGATDQSIASDLSLIIFAFALKGGFKQCIQTQNWLAHFHHYHKVDSPTLISVCLIYDSSVNHQLDRVPANWNTVSCFQTDVAQQFHIEVKHIISSLSCTVTLYCLKLQPQMKSSWLH